MDKKKIFIILIFLIFFFKAGNAEELILNLENKTLEVISNNETDQKITFIPFNKKKLKDVKEFNYSLIELKKIKKNDTDKIVKEKFNKEKYTNISSLLSINKSNLSSLKKKFENNNFSSIKIKKDDLNKLNEQNLKEKNKKYFFDRELKNNFVSDWHYTNKNNNFILQKVLNYNLKKDKNIFFIQFDNSFGPIKTNFVYEILNDGKKYKFVDSFTNNDIGDSLLIKNVENENSFYGFYPLEYENKIKENIIVDQIKLKEVVMFFPQKSKNNIRSLKYKIYKINNNYDNYYIELSNSNNIIIPGKSFLNFDNLISKDNLYKNLIEDHQHNLSGKKKAETLFEPIIKGDNYWKSSLMDLYNLLKNDNLNVAIYLENLSDQNKNVLLDKNKKNYFNLFLLNNLILKTILFAVIIVAITSIKLRIPKKTLNLIIKLTIISLLIIFMSSLLYGIKSFQIGLLINFIFGLVAYLIFYVVLLGKNSEYNL